MTTTKRKRALRCRIQSLILVIFVASVITSCGTDSDGEGNDLIPRGSVGAVVVYLGVTYEMDIVGACDPSPDGSFSVWAATIDSSGKPEPKQPHMYAVSDGNWSVIDIYLGENDGITRIYREGKEKLVFDGGRLEFESSVGSDSNQRVRVALACPE